MYGMDIIIDVGAHLRLGSLVGKLSTLHEHHTPVMYELILYSSLRPETFIAFSFFY